MSVIDDNWDYFIDPISFENNSYIEFDSKLSSFQSNLTKHLENGFKTQKCTISGKGIENQDDELKVLVEKNKELRQQIDKKQEDISAQQTQYERYKKDQKLLKQEIKETHEAFLMAKKYYKKFLKMYFTIESRNGEKQTIFVQFFTEAKKDSENYSVRLQRDTKTGHYQLLNTTPKLSTIKELQRRLQETNDVPGALCAIRQAFIDKKQILNKNTAS